jgi:hypothetical protein
MCFELLPLHQPSTRAAASEELSGIRASGQTTDVRVQSSAAQRSETDMSMSEAVLTAAPSGVPAPPRPTVSRAPAAPPTHCLTARILTQARQSWRSGELGLGISYTEAAASASCDRCDEPCALHARLQQALFYALMRRTKIAQRIVDEVREDPAFGGHRAFAAIAALVEAKIKLANGDIAGAAGQSRTGLQLADEAGQTAWSPLGNAILATTALRCGELATSIHYANRLKEDVVFGREILSTGQAAWIVIQVTEAEKGPQEAAGLAGEVLSSQAGACALLADEPAAIPWLVRLLLGQRLTDVAGHGVRLAERLATESPDIPELRAAASHAAGLLAGDTDRIRSAAETLADPWARALAIEDIGMVLAERGEESPAVVKHLDLAMRSYAEMGSLRDSSRVRSNLRRIKAYPESQVRLWPSSGIPGLTDTEYAVEQMFLSRHTVAFHLRKIFQKTGVKSRLELAVLWNELQTLPTSA